MWLPALVIMLRAPTRDAPTDGLRLNWYSFDGDDQLAPVDDDHVGEGCQRSPGNCEAGTFDVLLRRVPEGVEVHLP